MRYLPQTEKARAEMLNAIGVNSLEDLYKNIPESAFFRGDFDLPKHTGELEVERDLSAYAAQNHAAPNGPFFLGGGIYYHHVPSTVDYIIQRSEFLTAYTPYQPEIAQGTLQAIFEYQTFIAQITGQDVSNASLYDGATSVGEAALMAMRVTKRRNVHVATPLHPDYMDVLENYLADFDDMNIIDNIDETLAAIIVQSPDFYGNIHKYDTFRKKCNEVGALLIVVVTEIISLGLLEAPSTADIVCGEGQSIGLPMSFGGPHLGFFACKQKYVRQMPGRLCGISEDADGKRSFVLTLNTREQHIRRDKATSNICTNQGLCALAFTVHMALLGEDGFKRLAQLNHEAACKLADALSEINCIKILNDTFFNEFTIELPTASKPVVDTLAEKGIIAGLPIDDNKLIVAATEMTTDTEIQLFKTELSKLL